MSQVVNIFVSSVCLTSVWLPQTLTVNVRNRFVVWSGVGLPMIMTTKTTITTNTTRNSLRYFLSVSFLNSLSLSFLKKWKKKTSFLEVVFAVHLGWEMVEMDQGLGFSFRVLTHKIRWGQDMDKTTKTTIVPCNVGREWDGRERKRQRPRYAVK
jgi:hypothetical protein